ncbi:hypothetical protein [Salegentibacter salarius]|uniref:Uncharacterized protein n=1 Tax=Salegentibacter salarius TaxID=435906 RepID=A0A2N0TTH4_9FLAO|nr:hypothetical protein [Salegentibacter salarius]OEY72321.1 hypothetical protein BHS39_13580 [Salegentibacter salarius]PKD17978.1 hypothetical protein APR40_13545 [Salegentibacter salarius]SLK04021.1 hypothetical protein SAMN05660445_02781 [Salegentibacter salarius]
MKKLILIFLMIYSFDSYSQNKDYKFYNEEGYQISRKEFYNKKENFKNFPLYFENDTVRFGVLFHREKKGVLSDSTFTSLKNYLNTLKSEHINSKDIIVINFLTGVPFAEQIKKSKTSWNIFDRNYLRKLNKITDVSHFWISSLEKEKLKYFYSNKVNWQKDEDNIIKKIFFPHETTYGYYILINPEGKYYYSLGEYGKYNVWEKTEEMTN